MLASLVVELKMKSSTQNNFQKTYGQTYYMSKAICMIYNSQAINNTYWNP